MNDETLIYISITQQNDHLTIDGKMYLFHQFLQMLRGIENEQLGLLSPASIASKTQQESADDHPDQ